MKRGMKLFLNKKGDDKDLSLGPTELMYLILFGVFVLIIIGVIYYIKTFLK